MSQFGAMRTSATNLWTRASQATPSRAMRHISSSRNNGKIPTQTRLRVSVESAPSATRWSFNYVTPPFRMSPSSGERCWFSTSDSLCPKQIQVRLNEFQDLFVEARMCIDDVKDSVGTVYYEDDAEDARDAVDAAVKHFKTLLAEITDIDEKNKVLRSNGLKVEQLKGELELTLSGGHDHH
mmetsp:Transcript_15522/g.32141  ORF Transcript_15522/g.32141 Transcript_15522/m.32141 type:complete len:181 (+) Transcript_15522:70-612(+)